MNKPIQEDWEIKSYKRNWIIFFVIAALAVGGFWLLMYSEVSSNEDSVALLAVYADVAADFAPSEERTAFLTYVKKITSNEAIKWVDMKDADRQELIKTIDKAL